MLFDVDRKMQMTDFDAIPREPTLADRVTEELLEAIASGRLRPGSALATERAMGEQFGVSRTVIREAVRGLQAKGVLEVQAGRGATVALVSPSRVSEALELYVRGAQSQALISASDIAEIRSTLELKLVELACLRATDEDLTAIEHELNLMRDSKTPELSALHDAEFHRLIAGATHNALFVTLIGSINATMRAIRVRSLLVEGRAERAVEQHRAVFEAIRSRDPIGAWQAMNDHLEDSRHYYTGEPQQQPESEAV